MSLRTAVVMGEGVVGREAGNSKIRKVVDLDRYTPSLTWTLELSV